MKLVSLLYQIARTANDISKIGSIKKMTRRGVNKAIGRKVGPRLFVKGGKRK
ncbi:hypothetical protein ES705_30591 [subsurface metagenome]